MDVNVIAVFGKDLQARMRAFFEAPPGPDASPLEVVQAVLDDVERQVQPVGGRRRVFPWARVVVRASVSEPARAVLAPMGDDLRLRLLARLTEVRADVPGTLDVQVVCVDERPATWTAGQVFDVVYARDVVESAPASADPRDGQPPVLRLDVVAGTVTPGALEFAGATVGLGRGADPTDELGRLRRNRVAFVDEVNGVNETVGRAHARIRWDADARVYRLFDEGSRNGTTIVRDGEAIAVGRRDPRGVRLRSGDEIHLGRAILRLERS